MPIEIYKGRPIFYSLANFFWSDILEPIPQETYEANRDLLTKSFGEAGRPTDADLLAVWNAGSFDDPRVFETVIAVTRWQGGRVAEVLLYPVDLGYGRKLTSSGTPRLASPRWAEASSSASSASRSPMARRSRSRTASASSGCAKRDERQNRGVSPSLSSSAPNLGSARSGSKPGTPGEVEVGQALLFGSREHLEGRIDLAERAEQPGLGDDGGRPAGRARSSSRSVRASSCPACGRERPAQHAEEVGRAVRHRDHVLEPSRCLPRSGPGRPCAMPELSSAVASSFSKESASSR